MNQEIDISEAHTKHPKCAGVKFLTDHGYDYDCEYGAVLSCDECKYGYGGRDPEAKFNKMDR